MTTANKITMTRIAMIPFFIYFAAQPMIAYDAEQFAQSYESVFEFPTAAVIALILFCAASFTDFLDGYVARKYNQVTDFGKFVDPLADKLLVSSALILFAEQGAMAGWMVCVILARELIITSLRVVAANKGRVLAATWTGKVKTCVQIGGIILIYLLYIAVYCTGLTGSILMPPAILEAINPGHVSLVTIAGWVMTLVTIYSGYDYLKKNWDLIKDGAVKAK